VPCKAFFKQAFFVFLIKPLHPDLKGYCIIIQELSPQYVSVKEIDKLLAFLLEILCQCLLTIGEVQSKTNISRFTYLDELKY
jgi:hypothetical protein